MHDHTAGAILITGTGQMAPIMRLEQAHRPPPFTASPMQQEAPTKLGMNPASVTARRIAYAYGSCISKNLPSSTCRGV